MFPDTSKGQISLVARVYLMGQYRECFLLDACKSTQLAKVQIKGTTHPAIVHFHQIQNVALKYDNGEVVENFGAPKTDRPESIAYIRGYQYANQ